MTQRHGAPCFLSSRDTVVLVEHKTQRNWETDFDHTDPGYVESIWDVTRDLRTRCPMAQAKVFGGFKVISRADHVKAALTNPAVFISGAGITLPDAAPPVRLIPAEIDGHRHRAYRTLVNRWLSPTAVRARTGAVRAIVDESIDLFAHRGHCEFVGEFAHPVAGAVIFMLMGLPRTEWQMIRSLFQSVLNALGRDDREASDKAWAGMADYLEDHIVKRGENPLDDMLTELAVARIEDRALNMSEKIGIAFEFFTAGQDTTANAMALLAHHLAQHRSLQHRLRDDPRLIVEAIEEMLRWLGPVQTIARTAVQESEIGGSAVGRGERLALLIGSANRDESAFKNADHFDLDRPNKRQHIAFGYGVHSCAGMHLARLELQLTFERLLARLPDFELDGSGDIHFAGGMIYGFSRLPLRFRPTT